MLDVWNNSGAVLYERSSINDWRIGGQESVKLLYREVGSRDELDEDGAAAAAETWSEQTYQHVDVIAADHVFTDNSDAVVNTESRSVQVTPGFSDIFIK